MESKDIFNEFGKEVKCVIYLIQRILFFPFLANTGYMKHEEFTTGEISATFLKSSKDRPVKLGPRTTCEISATFLKSYSHFLLY